MGFPKCLAAFSALDRGGTAGDDNFRCFKTRGKLILSFLGLTSPSPSHLLSSSSALLAGFHHRQLASDLLHCFQQHRLHVREVQRL
jgi:hypothetical protein